jgi:hypothetical protein
LPSNTVSTAIEPMAIAGLFLSYQSTRAGCSRPAFSISIYALASVGSLLPPPAIGVGPYSIKRTDLAPRLNKRENSGRRFGDPLRGACRQDRF